MQFKLAALPPFLRLYIFDELCPPPPNHSETVPSLARRYDVDALVGVGETEWAAEAGLGPFEQTHWIELQWPAGGDVWQDELMLWEDTKSAGKIQIKVQWEPPVPDDIFGAE